MLVVLQIEKEKNKKKRKKHLLRKSLKKWIIDFYLLPILQERRIDHSIALPSMVFRFVHSKIGLHRWIERIREYVSFMKDILIVLVFNDAMSLRILKGLFVAPYIYNYCNAQGSGTFKGTTSLYYYRFDWLSYLLNWLLFILKSLFKKKFDQHLK